MALIGQHFCCGKANPLLAAVIRMFIFDDELFTSLMLTSSIHQPFWCVFEEELVDAKRLSSEVCRRDALFAHAKEPTLFEYPLARLAVLFSE